MWKFLRIGTKVLKVKQACLEITMAAIVLRRTKKNKELPSIVMVILLRPNIYTGIVKEVHVLKVKNIKIF